jgi:hypothetical protein
VPASRPSVSRHVGGPDPGRGPASEGAPPSSRSKADAGAPPRRATVAFGALLCIAGVVATLSSRHLALEGGTYIVFTGLIALGSRLLLRGVWDSL